MVDLSKYRPLFLSEGREHLDAMGQNLLALEEKPGDLETLYELFRHAHSLKGMSASMGYEAINVVSHRLEDFLDPYRQGERHLNRATADLLQDALRALGELLARVERGGDLGAPPADLLARLAAGPPEDVVAPPDPAARTPPEAPAAPPGAGAAAGEEMEVEPLGEVRINARQLDLFLDCVAELLLRQSQIVELTRHLDSPEIEEALDRLGQEIKTLHGHVLNVRLAPLSTLFGRLKLAVRDSARRRGKEVRLRVAGENNELDRAAIEELTTPLLHLLRNAVDHGIEPPEERRRAAKPETGDILLSAERVRDRVRITVADDGRGLDLDAVARRAAERGAPLCENPSPDDILDRLCLPGLSTAETVSDVSGRGVGMEVVKRTIEMMGGSLGMETERGRGTSFVLEVPMRVTILPVLIIRVKGDLFALPLAKILTTWEVECADGRFPDRAEIPRVEKPVPARYLGAYLGMGDAQTVPGGTYPVVVAETRDGLAALGVDSLVDQRDVVFRPPKEPIRRIDGVAGTAIIGGGRPVLVLDLERLLAARGGGPAPGRRETGGAVNAPSDGAPGGRR